MIDLYLSDYESFTFDDANVMREPHMVELENGLIAVGRDFCVFDSDGNVVPDTAHAGHPLPGKKTYKNPAYYDGAAIFCGGDRFFHFGHFLVEGLERVWPVLDKKYKNAKLVFVTSHDSMPGYAVEFLAMLGVGQERVILLNKSTRFRKLYVPARASRFQQYTSAMQNKVYQAIANSVPRKSHGDKIYLSRGRMGKLAIFGEGRVQRIFEKNGFKIVYPETLSIAEQVQMASGAKCIAGIAGTALHLCVFMPPHGRVIQLNRARHNSNAAVQYVLCRGVGADMTLVSASLDTLRDAGHMTDTPHIIGVTPQLKRFFDDNGFKYTAADIAPDAAEFKKYELAAAQYCRNHGRAYRVKKRIAKIIACMVPGYKQRSAVRHWMERLLRVDK